jgi:rhodanese-related sulfurtransferase
MSNAPSITLDELRRQLAAGAVTEFWNVLTDDYFSGELLPGSRRVPLDAVGREVTLGRVARDAAIVVYCANAACPQSRMAADKLLRLGFANVRAYEGGIAEWKEAGLPVERVTSAATAA